MTRWVARLVTCVLLSSCTGPLVITRTPASGSLAGPHRSEAPPAPEEARAEPITLIADLSAPPARWERIATIRFGERAEDLGFLLDPKVGSLASVPTSFAVAADGSLWILDDLKERLAHYGPNGRYLGQIALHRGPGATLKDVALTARGVAILHEIHPLSAGGELRIDTRIEFVDQGESVRSIVPRTDSGPVYVSRLFPWAESLVDESVVGDVRAYSDLSGTPSGRFARFAPEDGCAFFRPGLPLRDDLWAQLDGESEQDFDVTFITDDQTVTQPIHIRVVPTSGGRSLRALVGPEMEVALASGVGMLVQLQPSSAREADRYHDGRWYLQLGPGNEPLVWEPIPYGYRQQERQARHLARGPDGSVYLMVLTRTGEVVYRRP